MSAHRPWRGLLLLCIAGLILCTTPARAEYADGWRAFQRGEYTRAVDLWRQSAWLQDDIHAQKQLGDLYRQGKFVQRDLIESYVWYYLALINPAILGRSMDAEREMSELLREVVVQLDRLAFFMTEKQKQQAQDRIVYILSSRGAEGHFRLAEIYNVEDRTGAYGCSSLNSRDHDPRGYPKSDAPRGADSFARSASLWVFCVFNPRYPSFNVVPKNNMDALVHFMIANRLGQPAARLSLQSYNKFIVTTYGTTGVAPQVGSADSDAAGGIGPEGGIFPYNLRKYYAVDIIARAEALAEVWQPPFEVYPGGHSDESKGPFERQDALKRVASELDPRFLQEALKFLTFYEGEVDGERGGETKKAIARYQASIGAPTTGNLSPEDTVRLIKDVADRGYAPVQAALGTMYFHGIGEPQNYARAEFWFEKASDQLNPYALFNLAVMYRDGLGVELDASQAATYFIMAKRVLQSQKKKSGTMQPEIKMIDRELRALGWASE
jgi:TPR repeat protein